jgi:hypothetical protein
MAPPIYKGSNVHQAQRRNWKELTKENQGGGDHGDGEHIREGEAANSGACSAMLPGRVPCSDLGSPQHGHQQDRLHRLPQLHRIGASHPFRLLPGEVSSYILFLFSLSFTKHSK